MEMAADTGILFWLLAGVVLISGFMVVSLRNIFHCAIFLIVCLTGVAGIFLTLGAEFLAAAQVLIYVGAVSILMIFAVMLTSKLTSRNVRQTSENVAVVLFACAIFGLGATWVVAGTEIWQYATQALPAHNVAAIGKLLMTEYMLPFEVVSILLLAAMIGAIVLARGEES